MGIGAPQEQPVIRALLNSSFRAERDGELANHSAESRNLLLIERDRHSSPTWFAPVGRTLLSDAFNFALNRPAPGRARLTVVPIMPPYLPSATKERPLGQSTYLAVIFRLEK